MTAILVEVALIALTNTEGKLLVQHRTDDAPKDPNLWTIPGGGVEPGEKPIDAAHRELLEETGLTVASLDFLRVLDRESHSSEGIVRFHVYTGRTTATQEDVICGEGQAMVFLTPAEIRSRELTWATATVLPEIL